MTLAMFRVFITRVGVGVISVALGATSLMAGGNKNDADTGSARSRFVFSLLPKSFQRKPRLDFNVYTEMTPEGRQRGLPTAEKPAYYIINVDKPQSRGFTSLGIERYAPKPEAVEQMVANALNVNHFLPAKDGGPRPTLVMLVHWGSYSNPIYDTLDVDFENTDRRPVTAREALPYVLSSVVRRKVIIERATLIGGADFAKELNDVLNKEVSLRRGTDSADAARAAAGSEGTSVLAMLEAMSPLVLFMQRDERTEEMVEEVFADSYYVIVSALDYASVAQKRPIVLWRTKLSLNASGVALDETVGPMINSGANYFGRETAKAVVVTKRIDREGKVDVGESRAVEFIDPGEKPATKPETR